MIKFIYERSKENQSVSPVNSFEMSIDDEASIDDLLDAFEDFVRAIGYVVDKYSIRQIIPDDGK